MMWRRLLTFVVKVSKEMVSPLMELINIKTAMRRFQAILRSLSSILPFPKSIKYVSLLLM